MEGIAAIAIVFILFTVLAQAATALIAHRAAHGAVAAAAARVAIAPNSAHAAASRLTAEIEAVVPGATEVTADIDVGSQLVRVVARLRITPPGPMLRPIGLEVVADAPLVVEP